MNLPAWRRLTRRYTRQLDRLRLAQLDLAATLGAMARELDEIAERGGLPQRLTPRAEQVVQQLADAYAAARHILDGLDGTGPAGTIGG